MLVSILIPCYNAERWIAQCIESALAQTWPDKEIIVVDDGSTDGSLATIKSFGDRIRWETGPNRGGNAARNRLLELARGGWLQYLDADDYLLPEKVAAHASFVVQYADADIIYGPVTLEYCSPHDVRLEPLDIPEPHDPWVLLARWYLPQTGAPLWRKQAIMEVGGWNIDQPCCQEHELYLRLLMAHKQFVFCPQNGAIYRQWSDLTISNRDKSKVRGRRLEIEQKAEDFLRETGEMTFPRQWAINQARFEMARLAWQHSHCEAVAIMRNIRRSQPGFRPAGSAAPPAYRFLLRVIGFRGAETLADWRRRWFPTTLPSK